MRLPIELAAAVLLDHDWAVYATDVAIGAFARTSRLLRRNGTFPEFGNEQIRQLVGHDELVDPYTLAIHTQHARWLGTTGGVIPQPDSTALYAQSRGHCLLRGVQAIAEAGIKQEPQGRISFNAALGVAALHLQERQPTNNHVVNTAVGVARESFDLVNLQFQAQQPA